MFRNSYSYNRAEHATEEELRNIKQELRDLHDECSFRFNRLETELGMQDWNGASDRMSHLEQLINHVYQTARKGSNKHRKVTIISGSKVIEVTRQ